MCFIFYRSLTLVSLSLGSTSPRGWTEAFGSAQMQFLRLKGRDTTCTTLMPETLPTHSHSGKPSNGMFYFLPWNVFCRFFRWIWRIWQRHSSLNKLKQHNVFTQMVRTKWLKHSIWFEVGFFCSCCRGLHKLVMKNITYGIGELYRGIFIGEQVKILQKYIPELSLSDVTRYSNDATLENKWTIKTCRGIFTLSQF